MRSARVVAAAVAAVVVGAGAVVTPVVLAARDNGSAEQRPGQFTGQRMDPGDGPGWGMRDHMRPDGFGPRAGMGPGGDMGPGQGLGPRRTAGQDCPLLGGAAKGTLTKEQRQSLARNAEEEKLAHDVYVTLADTSGDVRFAHIARAESQHLRAVRTLLARYDVEDPTKGLARGEFATASMGADHERYVTTGSASADKALQVARQIERQDVAELEQSLEGLEARDVTTLYEHLQQASEMHLQAFSRPLPG